MSAIAEAPPVAEDPGPPKEQVQLPLFEGVRVTDFRMNFGGNVEIGDLDLIKALGESFRKGTDVELRIVVRAVSVGGKTHTDGAGNRTGMTKSQNVTVTAVELAAGADGD